MYDCCIYVCASINLFEFEKFEFELYASLGFNELIHVRVVARVNRQDTDDIVYWCMRHSASMLVSGISWQVEHCPGIILWKRWRVNASCESLRFAISSGSTNSKFCNPVGKFEEKLAYTIFSSPLYAKHEWTVCHRISVSSFLYFDWEIRVKMLENWHL